MARTNEFQPDQAKYETRDFSQVLVVTGLAREGFDLWDDHFTPDHLVRVMGGWQTNTWVTEQLLDWNNASQHTDAFATAPYFGGSLE